MAKKLLILILGIAVSLFISFTFFAAYAPQSVLFALPTALCLALPLCLVFLHRAARGKKAERFWLHAQEAVIGPYLYLLICLTLGAAGLFFVMAAKLPCPPAGLYLSGLALLFLCAVFAGRLHAERIAVRRFSLRVPAGRERGRLRAVVFSDLHLGAFTTRRFLARLCGKIAREAPDLILFAGDFFDGYFDDVRRPDETAAAFEKLSRAGGFFACPGNHDAQALNDARAKSFLNKAGIVVFCDEKADLPLFTLWGRKDRDDRARLSAEALPDADGPVVVLDHQPKEVDALFASGAALVLCGHTHNGQTFPGNLVTHVLERYPHGLRKRPDGRAVYTCGGAGFWGFPLRLFTANEIAVFDIFFD